MRFRALLLHRGVPLWLSNGCVHTERLRLVVPSCLIRGESALELLLSQGLGREQLPVILDCDELARSIDCLLPLIALLRLRVLILLPSLILLA